MVVADSMRDYSPCAPRRQGSLLLHLGMAEAIDRVIVDHAHRLHECIADGRAHKVEPARLQVLAQRPRLLRLGGYLRQRLPVVLDGPTADKAPQVASKLPYSC